MLSNNIVNLPELVYELPVAVNIQFSKARDADVLGLFMWVKTSFNMSSKDVMVYAIKLLYQMIRFKQANPEGQLMYIPSNKLNKVTKILNGQ